MSYYSVSDLLSMGWYSTAKLIDCIQNIRKINFSIVEQRNQALERLNSIPAYSPFARDRRFPEKGTWVCEMAGDWARKFQQLRSALSFKDRAIEVKQSEKDPNFGLSQNFQDAMNAFWNSTTAFLDQYSRGDGVFNRRKFEDYFELVWDLKLLEYHTVYEGTPLEIPEEIPAEVSQQEKGNLIQRLQNLEKFVETNVNNMESLAKTLSVLQKQIQDLNLDIGKLHTRIKTLEE